MKIYGIHVSALTCYNINRLFPGVVAKEDMLVCLFCGRLRGYDLEKERKNAKIRITDREKTAVSWIRLHGQSVLPQVLRKSAWYSEACLHRNRSRIIPLI